MLSPGFTEKVKYDFINALFIKSCLPDSINLFIAVSLNDNWLTEVKVGCSYGVVKLISALFIRMFA